ncbi:MAG: ferrochelatase [Candidatus Cloacimonetes bacterium]|nr:ferrochelatase [Candidatus Cloacimonadota bacterium]
MKVAVMLLNFGEPEHPDEEEVVPFLERIFLMNGELEGRLGHDKAVARAHELAVARAPGLIEEYREIGGSPLHRQAEEQAVALDAELTRRGLDARCYVGMQFTEPFIHDAVARARADGCDTVIGLPVYPLCGTSTTVMSLGTLADAMQQAGWEAPRLEISGWHRHPAYTALRADGIRRILEQSGESFDNGCRLVFSAHGIPLKYLREGNRYDAYVEESCRAIADAVGVDDYVVGFQNHTNRPIEWTSPDIDEVIENIDAESVVVFPVSFMHEQSETLAELDHELREVAERRGLRFHRVPVPHDDARFIGVLADLVQSRLGLERTITLGPCTCRPDAATHCTNHVLRN